MNWFETIVTGLIQRLAEFLPVSNSGHLEIQKSTGFIITMDKQSEQIWL
jgi:undecaprenyl pyrophosphate phosphatase UppP